MQTTNCDICNKVRKDDEEFATAWLPRLRRCDICLLCARKYCGPLLKKLEAAEKKVGLAK